MGPVIRLTLMAALGAGLCGAATAEELQHATLEPGMARPGGVYATVSAADPAACAQACADDALCMSWTLVEAPAAPLCELKAVIPPAVPDLRATSGLSARAPSFARLVGVSTPSPIGPPRALVELPEAPAAPVAVSVSVAPPPPAASETVAAADPAPVIARAPQADAPILLGADTAPLPLRERLATAARP